MFRGRDRFLREIRNIPPTASFFIGCGLVFMFFPAAIAWFILRMVARDRYPSDPYGRRGPDPRYGHQPHHDPRYGSQHGYYREPQPDPRYRQYNPNPNPNPYQQPQSQPTQTVYTAPPKEEPKKKNRFDYSKVADDEVKKILRMGDEKLDEIEKYKNRIKDESMQKKVDKVSAAIEAIFQNFIVDPSDIKKSRQFLNYYLDSTMKILKKYVELSNKEVYSDNIRDTLNKVEVMMDTLEESFRKHLAKLQENDLMDLDVEMEVLEKNLRMGGF